MDIERIKRDFQRAQTIRQRWHPIWQILREYVALVRQSFDSQNEQADILTKEIYDSTAIFAAQNSASALLGQLWPGGSQQSFEIVAPEDLKDSSTELAQFYERMTRRAAMAMDAPEANLALALDEYMLDQMIIGTSGVGVEREEDGSLLYKAYGVQEVFVRIGKNGKVNGLFLFFEWAVDRVVDEYGLDACSGKVREKYKAGSFDDKIKILVSIGKRTAKKAIKGKLAMPIEAIHIEFDGNHILKEDGFNGLPIFVGRFRKLPYEHYGRSPAMNGLPDIREANVLREAVIVATEKNLDPPLGVLSDSILGNNTIDTSSGAISVFDGNSSIGNRPPVFPLVTVGSLSDALARLEKLEQVIAQHFSLDRLLDMNNEQQMTLGEAQIRNGIRMASLSSLYSRQYAEVLVPLIERSIELKWNAGDFGVSRGSPMEKELLKQGVEPDYIPDVLVQRQLKNQDLYQVRFKTPAIGAQRAQEYMALLDVANVALTFSQGDPTLLQRIDMHAALKHIGGIRGIPSDVIRQDDVFNELMEKQQKQAQMAQELATAQSIAATAKDAAAAQQAFRQ